MIEFKQTFDLQKYPETMKKKCILFKNFAKYLCQK
jgi:hypothetical protein